MFLSFSKTLQTALDKADEVARRFQQEYVGREHLLLAIIGGGEGDAVRVLKNAVDLPKLESVLAKALPHGAELQVTGKLSLSPNARQAIETATASAQRNEEKKISTRYVLMALMKDKESAIGQALNRSGADFDELCAALRQKPAQPED
jgi:ATP-dependent Clp protease ATP-binding subunit ClpC